MVERKCKHCGKKINNCYNTQKYHKKCFKQKMKEYSQKPEVKQKMKEYSQKPEVKQKKKEYYQKPEVKQKMKEYSQKPEVKQKKKEYMKEKYFVIKHNWESLSDEEQLRLMNKKAKEILSNQSPTSQTTVSPKHNTNYNRLPSEVSELNQIEEAI